MASLAQFCFCKSHSCFSLCIIQLFALRPISMNTPQVLYPLSCRQTLLSLCYGLNCVSLTPKLIRSPDHPALLQKATIFGDQVFEEVMKLNEAVPTGPIPRGSRRRVSTQTHRGTTRGDGPLQTRKKGLGVNHLLRFGGALPAAGAVMGGTSGPSPRPMVPCDDRPR